MRYCTIFISINRWSSFISLKQNTLLVYGILAGVWSHCLVSASHDLTSSVIISHGQLKLAWVTCSCFWWKFWSDKIFFSMMLVELLSALEWMRFGFFQQKFWSIIQFFKIIYHKVCFMDDLVVVVALLNFLFIYFFLVLLTISRTNYSERFNLHSIYLRIFTTTTNLAPPENLLFKKK